MSVPDSTSKRNKGKTVASTEPRRLPTPDEVELAGIFKKMDKGREPIEEDAELIEAIQHEVRKYRSEKRRQK